MSFPFAPSFPFQALQRSSIVADCLGWNFWCLFFYLYPFISTRSSTFCGSPPPDLSQELSRAERISLSLASLHYRWCRKHCTPLNSGFLLKYVVSAGRTCQTCWFMIMDWFWRFLPKAGRWFTKPIQYLSRVSGWLILQVKQIVHSK